MINSQTINSTTEEYISTPKTRRSVVITGGSGCLGQHLVKELIHYNEELELGITDIVILDVKEWEPFWRIFTKDEAQHSGLLEQTEEDGMWFPSRDQEDAMVKFYSVDLCSREAVFQLFENELLPQFKIESIFHMMASTKMWAPSLNHFTVPNVDVTRILLDAALKYSIPNFIYTSSGAVFWKPGHPELTNVSEEDIEIVHRDENGQVIGVDLKFAKLPESVDYGYVITKQRAHEMVIAESWKAENGKKLNTMCLSITTALYGEADSFGLAKTFVSYGYMVKLGTLVNNVYAGNAAYCHVLALKSLFDPAKRDQVRGRTFIVSEETISNHTGYVREVMKHVTGDSETYSDKNAKEVPIFAFHLMNYMFKAYNYSIHTLSSCYNGAKNWFAFPAATDFLIEWSFRKGIFTTKSERARKELGYVPKYHSDQVYKQTARYLLQMEKLGHLKIYREK